MCGSIFILSYIRFDCLCFRPSTQTLQITFAFRTLEAVVTVLIKLTFSLCVPLTSSEAQGSIFSLVLSES